MSRKIGITLLLLLSIGIMLPIASSTAHGIRQSFAAKHYRHHRHHSRAWWRRYRARMRRKRLAALAHRNVRLTAGVPENIALGNVAAPAAAMTPVTPVTNSAENVKLTAAKSGGSLPGQMSLAVVALSRPNPPFLTAREESRMLAGISVSDLRRIVIDKMVVAGGWVTNDFVRDVNGARVFIVTAHTPKDARSPESAWNFYFTEAGGRVYSLTTNAPVEYADRMTNEAERFISSFRSGSGSQTGNR